MNIRARSEQLLARSLEGSFGLPVILVGPDGRTYDTRVSDGRQLKGQILFDYVDADSGTGMTFVVHAPVVTLRRSSLERVPAPGEKWLVRIPMSNDPYAEIVTHALSPDRAPEGGDSVGLIRLYLQAVEQSA